MTATLQKRLINVKEYHLMGKVGILKEKGIELIEGEIIKMSPTGSKHASCVNRLTNLLTKTRLVNQLEEKVIISVQNPIALGEFSEPEPDLALLKYKADFYADTHPTPQDVLLLIEVADSTLETDRKIKAPLYAKAGIPEYWIVNLEEKQLEVFHSPKAGAYQQKNIFSLKDQAQAQFNEHFVVRVAEILPS